MLERVKYNFPQVMRFLEKKFRDPQIAALSWVLNIAHKSLFFPWLSSSSLTSQPLFQTFTHLFMAVNQPHLITQIIWVHLLLHWTIRNIIGVFLKFEIHNTNWWPSAFVLTCFPPVAKHKCSCFHPRQPDSSLGVSWAGLQQLCFCRGASRTPSEIALSSQV